VLCAMLQGMVIFSNFDELDTRILDCVEQTCFIPSLLSQQSPFSISEHSEKTSFFLPTSRHGSSSDDYTCLSPSPSVQLSHMFSVRHLTGNLSEIAS
jgi:hypothetical protein